MTDTNTERITDTLFPESNPMENISILNYLYQNRDSILRSFQLRYLQMALYPLPEGIEVRVLNGAEDPNRIMDVLRDGEIIAGIYIETNLYLQVEDSYAILDADSSNNPSRWRYLYRRSSQSPICLKRPWANTPPLSDQGDDRICNLKALCDAIVPIELFCSPAANDKQ